MNHANRSAWALALLATATLSLAAFGEAQYAEHFNPKIDTWAEGVIVSLDADGAKFSIRGSKNKYASEYAAMLQKIHEETEGLSGTQRQTREDEIRKIWADKLAHAQKNPATRESDISFSLPSEDGKLSVLNEKGKYGADNPAPAPPAGVKMSETEAAALTSLKSLKLGERVAVGYEAGILYNTAHTVIQVGPVIAGAGSPPNDGNGAEGNAESLGKEERQK